MRRFCRILGVTLPLLVVATLLSSRRPASVHGLDSPRSLTLHALPSTRNTKSDLCVKTWRNRLNSRCRSRASNRLG